MVVVRPVTRRAKEAFFARLCNMRTIPFRPMRRSLGVFIHNSYTVADDDVPSNERTNERTPFGQTNFSTRKRNDDQEHGAVGAVMLNGRRPVHTRVTVIIIIVLLRQFSKLSISLSLGLRSD